MRELIMPALVCKANFSHAASKANVICIIADDLGYGFNCQRQAHHFRIGFIRESEGSSGEHTPVLASLSQP